MSFLPDIKYGMLVTKKKKKKKKQKPPVFKKKASVIGSGENCPKCSKPMQRREHSEIGPKQRKAWYYFKEWDYCPQCHHLQHYEWAKVFNNKKYQTLAKKPMVIQQLSRASFDEVERQNSFLSSL